jgi:hypothetical protein
MIINGLGVIECKLTAAYPTDNEPLKWRGWDQLKVQCEILDVSWGMLIVFHHTVNELRYYFYQRDPNFAKELRQVADDWQRRVKTKTYFDPATSEDAYIMFEDEEIKEDVLELEPTTLDLLAQIENLDETIKSATKTKDALMARLMHLMGNFEKAVCDTYQIDWGLINYKAQPEKIVPAKEAYSVRRKIPRIKKRAHD